MTLGGYVAHHHLNRVKSRELALPQSPDVFEGAETKVLFQLKLDDLLRDWLLFRQPRYFRGALEALHINVDAFHFFRTVALCCRPNRLRSFELLAHYLLLLDSPQSLFAALHRPFFIPRIQQFRHI